jgi:mannose-6-phosphate isomerase-like protein (cupin superfamily)
MDRSQQYALFIALLACICCPMHADERQIDPTFLYRDTSAVQAKPSDLTTASCHYKPLFGIGDSDTSTVVGIARYGEAVIDPNGACAPVQYPDEDQVYVVLDGKGAVQYGKEVVSLNQEDYLYLPSTVPHTLSNSSASPLTVVVMGFHTEGFEKTEAPAHAFESQH